MDIPTFLRRLGYFLIVSWGLLIAMVLIKNSDAFTSLADVLSLINR